MWKFGRAAAERGASCLEGVFFLMGSRKKCDFVIG
jgi:hypothetical protein